MLLLLVALTVLFAILGTFFYFRYQQVSNEVKELQEKYDGLLIENKDLKQKNEELSQKYIENKTLVSTLETQLQSEENEKNSKEQEIKNLQEKITKLSSDNASYLEKIKTLETALQTQKQELLNLQEQFRKEFELISKNLLEQNAIKLEEKNQQSITHILSPVKDVLQQNVQQIKEIEQRIQKYYDNENKERASLKTVVEELTKRSEEVKLTAEKLANALTTQVKYQGNWGEFILEKLLEISGLQEGIHFVTQQKSDDKQPDVTILLPNQKHIIIDSKMTLSSFVEYQSATTEEEKNKFANEIIKSIEQHIDNLSNKEYEKIYNLHSVDFVLMFVPIEPIINIIHQYKPEIYNLAIRKKVLMVSPTSLLATLKAIYFVWQQEHQRKEFENIIIEIGKLYEKLRVFIDKHFTKIKDALQAATNAYEEAEKSLVTGKGNALSIIEKKIKPFIQPKENITKLLPENDEE
ncbi:MAG: DNA recombination protein RmuC [Bacteroidia bacterium]|nr:DNA recombination protein RmuC [Bacteroidia bacterium]